MRLVMVAILSVAAGVAVSKPAPAQAPAPFDAGQVQIAIVQNSSQGDYFQQYLNGTKKQAEALKLKLDVYDAQGDNATQAAQLDQAIVTEMERIAVAAYRALGCEGWGRVDVLMRAADSKLFLLEVNTSPGMTGHSLVPMAARAEGTSYEDLCLEIVSGASLKMHKGQR